MPLTRRTTARWVICFFVVFAVWLWSPASSWAGQPIGGASSIICTESGCTEAQTVQCRARAFAFGQQCWSRGEGRKFVVWLRAHGSTPARFEREHPRLAAMFKQPWPPRPERNWAQMNRNFRVAAGYAQERLGVSASWLVSCASTEGGTNPGYVAIGSAGEVGWMQYLPGTWAWMSNSAFQTRGHPPRAYRQIRSMLGQVWTAGWAFSRGYSHHWHGSGC